MITATKSTITLKDATRVNLDRALIAPMHRPAGGWRARMRIKGVDREFTGRTPEDTARAIRIEFQRNHIPLKTEDLWLALNLQWYEKVDSRYHQASLTALTEMMQVIPDAPEAPTNRKLYTPEVWGSVAWRWLGLILAQDSYDPRQFLAEMERVLAMLNPASSPTLGCILCFSHFAETLRRVRLQMPQNREDARQFLWRTHNEVNARLSKPQISYDAASKANFWL